MTAGLGANWTWHTFGALGPTRASVLLVKFFRMWHHDHKMLTANVDFPSVY